MSRTIRNRAPRFLRRPKTTAERRAAYAALEDGVKPRAKRGPKRLVNAWDDIPVSKEALHRYAGDIT
jgi:hypothetical protein